MAIEKEQTKQPQKAIRCFTGGEHIITLSAVQAFLRVYPSFLVPHFDARPFGLKRYIHESVAHSACGDEKNCKEAGPRQAVSIWYLFGDRNEIVLGKSIPVFFTRGIVRPLRLVLWG